MSELTIVRTISAPSDAVWNALASYGDIKDWNPNLSDSRLLAGSKPQGVGAERQCDMRDGKNWIRERVVEWREGESYTIDIYEGTMPLASAQATLGVRAVSARESEAYMEFTYTPKFGPLGALMDVMMMKSMMTKSMTALLEGLDAHVRKQREAA